MIVKVVPISSELELQLKNWVLELELEPSVLWEQSQDRGSDSAFRKGLWMCYDYVVRQHLIACTNCIWVFKREIAFCWIFFWSYVRFGVWRLLFCQISSKHWSKDVCSLSFMLGAKLFNKTLIHLKTFYQNWSKDVKISCLRIKKQLPFMGTLWLRTLSMSFNLGLSCLLQ